MSYGLWFVNLTCRHIRQHDLLSTSLTLNAFPYPISHLLYQLCLSRTRDILTNTLLSSYCFPPPYCRVSAWTSVTKLCSCCLDVTSYLCVSVIYFFLDNSSICRVFCRDCQLEWKFSRWKGYSPIRSLSILFTELLLFFIKGQKRSFGPHTCECLVLFALFQGEQSPRSFASRGRELHLADGGRVSFAKGTADLPHQQLRYDVGCFIGMYIRKKKNRVN